jgi:hypothetical protein
MITLEKIKSLISIDYSIPQGLIWKVNNPNGLAGRPCGFFHGKFKNYYCKIGNKQHLLSNKTLIYALRHNVELDKTPYTLSEGTVVGYNSNDLEKGIGGFKQKRRLLTKR